MGMRTDTLTARPRTVAPGLGVLGGLLLVAGCATTVEPPPALPAPGAFSHAELDRVQARFVDAHGLVDYRALAQDRADLDAYYRRVAGVSPRSHPRLFPEREDELAYWINAYNALVLVTVLEHYPIASVGDVPAPLLLRPLLWGNASLAGFFVFRELRLGGETLNLYDLENEIIRSYGEPRIHFAINCASLGCPELPQHAFHADRLDAELAREARHFFADPEKLRIDHEARAIRLSPILDWFEKDFTDWLEQERPGSGAELLDYVRLHLAPERRAELDAAREAGYTVHFLEYDWSLNDRARSSDAASRQPPRTSTILGVSALRE